jgi:DNA-binding HxlR family transcriptional regulator
MDRSVRALSLLAAPLNVHLLKALEPGPLGPADLHRAVGSPPQSTIRVYLRMLTDLGVVERRREGGFPGTVEYELSACGEKLLAVGEVLQRWLGQAPEGPISLGSIAARSATKALVDGWSSRMVRALAARSLALTELSRLINGLNYPTLERRLNAMRVAGLIQPSSNRSGRAVPYEVTEWMRGAVAPALAAVAWERRWIPEHTPPLGRADVESALLLCVPLLRLPAGASGSCRLAVELRKGSEVEFVGVKLSVDEGRVTSCVSRLEGTADAWVTGSPSDWFSWIGHEERQAELGGKVDLAESVGSALREALVAREPLYS